MFHALWRLDRARVCALTLVLAACGGGLDPDPALVPHVALEDAGVPAPGTVDAAGFTEVGPGPAAGTCRGVSCEWARWPGNEHPVWVRVAPGFTDAVTGLMWESTSQRADTHARALEHCAHLAAAHHPGWRLPSVNEWLSVARVSVPDGSGGAQPGMEGLHWAATRQHVGGAEERVFAVDVSTGAVVARPVGVVAPADVRCVRGDVHATEGRFEVAPDEVTDGVTGLVWLRTANTGRTWDQANTACETAVLGGESDWRLPTLKEAMGLVDLRHPHPAVARPLTPSAAPGVRAPMWTASYALGRSGHWVVDEDTGEPAVVQEETAGFRCVRRAR